MTATLADAIKLAVHAHEGALDNTGREPYVLHPIRVMLKQGAEHARMAAVLHDVVEDAATTFADLEALGFPPPVIEALNLLTHADNTPYEQYVRRLAANPIARRVKLADLEDNMDVRGLEALAERDHRRLDKYLAAWRMLQAAGAADA